MLTPGAQWNFAQLEQFAAGIKWIFMTFMSTSMAILVVLPIAIANVASFGAPLTVKHFRRATVAPANMTSELQLRIQA